jgi:hypothetical protein
METQHESQTPVTPGLSGTEPDPFICRPSGQNIFQDLINDELQVLVTLAINALHGRGISVLPSGPPAPKVPNIFNNAKFEQIACAGLQNKI